MAERQLAHDQWQRSNITIAPMRDWVGGIKLTVAVGLGYFLAARLSFALQLQADGVSVFWPATGIASGVLIAFGTAARWPVVTGTMAGGVLAVLMGGAGVAVVWAAPVFALCALAEALITAELIRHYFGSAFNLDQLRNVLGLLAAAVAGTAIAGIGGAVAFTLFRSQTVPMVVIWQHWFMSNVLGIIAVAPLIIEFRAVVQEPPQRREFIEGTAVLVALGLMCGIIVSLPPRPWQTAVPSALLFPMLLWLAARCQPMFAAAGAFVIALLIVWAATFGVGHFGEVHLPVGDRILQAQAIILTEAIGAYVLAALFAERRESEARLTQANNLLQRERDNKLMNIEAITSSIAHEVKQPLAAISANLGAAIEFLEMSPPDLHKATVTLNDADEDVHRTADVLDGIRSLFGGGRDQPPQSVNMNDIVLETLQSLRAEMQARGIAASHDLTFDLPPVTGHKSQLQEVVLNLVNNALEAMDNTAGRSRKLEIITRRHDASEIVVAVKDTGPGIDAKQLGGIFDAFVTTKSKGMGLGLAICRAIVERHGGLLTAHSEGENGALFQFVLPIKPSDPATDV